MGEDKLSHRQRLRLESLNQVHQNAQLYWDHRPADAEIFKKAEEIEKWLMAADRELN